jgi:hypothetical protein
MYRCNVIAIVAFLATLIFIICVGNMGVFPAHKATVIAFTTSNVLTNPGTSRTVWSSLWSMPPHPILPPPEASRQHDDFVSIKNPITANRRSFIQHGLISILGLNAITTTTSSLSFVTNRDAVNAMEIDTSAFRPATEDQPQIPFPDINALKEMEAADTLEGTSRNDLRNENDDKTI